MEKPFERGLHGLDTGPQPSDTSAAPAGGAVGEAAEHASVAALRETFGSDILRHIVYAGDEHTVFIPEEKSAAILRWLKQEKDQRYDLLQDLTAVDYGGGRPIEVVYQMWTTSYKRQLRVKVALPLDQLEIDSVANLWQTADWLEREVFDLFGIHFRGHPDMRRILMPENYAEGHPLRKDFPLRGRFSRAEQTRRALEMDVADFYTPTELAVGGEPLGSAESTPDRG